MTDYQIPGIGHNQPPEPLPAPHSRKQATIVLPRFKPGPHVDRHGAFAKGTILPETIVQHSPRRRVADFPEGWLPRKWFETLENNQLIASCCRHPENHDIEALKSHPEEPAADIYIFHCSCGRKHRRFMVGEGVRPEWR